MLGTAVLWAIANDLSPVNLILDENRPDLAFAAAGFGEPTPRVWRADGRALVAIDPEPPLVPPPPECPDALRELDRAGLDVVADHGVWLGEVHGLEVARVGHLDGSCVLDIGVGVHDQLAAALDRSRSERDKLTTVVDLVRTHRRAGSAPHPIGRLVRSRWLRSRAMADPDLVGVDALVPTPLLVPRPGLNETQTAAGLGRRGDDEVLVLFGVGIDVGIPETAAGLLHHHQPDEVVVVVPPRDRHHRIDAMVAALDRPSAVVELEGEWAD